MRKLLLLTIVFLPLFGETKLGETRLGFEVTPVSNFDIHAYNFKFK